MVARAVNSPPPFPYGTSMIASLSACVRPSPGINRHQLQLIEVRLWQLHHNAVVAVNIQLFVARHNFVAHPLRCASRNSEKRDTFQSSSAYGIVVCSKDFRHISFPSVGLLSYDVRAHSESCDMQKQ